MDWPQAVKEKQEQDREKSRFRRRLTRLVDWMEREPWRWFRAVVRWVLGKGR